MEGETGDGPLSLLDLAVVFEVTDHRNLLFAVEIESDSVFLSIFIIRVVFDIFFEKRFRGGAEDGKRVSTAP